ncbi:MAG TPA: 30S ribosomal protein S4 [bacterium]|nr:30S ribosomal protein S4 [Myxococcales bacterium]OQA58607.1 MAG: 30S ribosomal protein S4 [bacterium ADurb.Bin270]HPW45353.1 30S ribosomal protein S4 [bacterium]HQG14015.1 30S ribosomal protein S4 [bacterium]
MARNSEPSCRQCRREGIKLFLKGDRCYADRCAFERRPYSPGQHGQSRRKKHSDYGLQLREKQRAKLMYGVLERQFHKYFEIADRMKGVTGDNLLLILERRLDNMVYRMGFANSREQARQLVMHGHFSVNGKKVSIPSYLVRQGDTITVREKSRKIPSIIESLEAVERRGVPEWLMLEKDKFEAKVMAYPTREQLNVPIQEQLIVELYSK